MGSQLQSNLFSYLEVRGISDMADFLHKSYMMNKKTTGGKAVAGETEEVYYQVIYLLQLTPFAFAGVVMGSYV